MAATILLDRTANDLCLDASGNIAVATEPYSQAQDVASAAKVFLGECWYSTTQGLPYFQQILGNFQPVQIFKESAVAAAKRVPGVTDAEVYLISYKQRVIRGQIQFKTAAGVQGVSI